MAKRLMGKSSGATITDDGSIDLAPMYADEFRSLARREASLWQIQTGTLKFVQSGFDECHRDSARLWRRVSEDLGLDFDNNEVSIQHRGVDGARLIIKPLPKEQPSAPEPQEEKL